MPQLCTKMFESLRNEKKNEEISEGVVSEMTEEKSASDLVEAGSEPVDSGESTQETGEESENVVDDVADSDEQGES